MLKPTDEADKVMGELAAGGIPMGIPMGAPMNPMQQMQQQMQHTMQQQMQRNEHNAERPVQQQQRNTQRMVSQKKMRPGLPQGKVVVRSKATAGVEQENVRDKPLVQRNAPLRRSVDSDRETPRLREIPPSAHPHPNQFHRDLDQEY